MAHKLMSEAEFQKAVECYATLPDPDNPYVGREKFFYKIVSRKVKHFPNANGGFTVMVKIAPRDHPNDSGWYPMNSLFFVMPDGSIRK